MIGPGLQPPHPVIIEAQNIATITSRKNVFIVVPFP
jgi:hypothetical protein